MEIPLCPQAHNRGESSRKFSCVLRPKSGTRTLRGRRSYVATLLPTASRTTIWLKALPRVNKLSAELEDMKANKLRS